jgi:hypothetical protein
VVLAAAALLTWLALGRHLPGTATERTVVAAAAVAFALLALLALAVARLLAPAEIRPSGMDAVTRRRLVLLGVAVALACLTAVLSLTGLPRSAADVTRAAAAVVVGVTVADLVERGWWALAAAAAITLTDIASVAAGPTKILLQHGNERTLSALVVALPAPDLDEASALGVSDIVFLAFFCAVAVRFGGRPRIGAAAMAAGLVMTMALVFASDRALPALPLLALGFALTNGDRLLPRRQP